MVISKKVINLVFTNIFIGLEFLLRMEEENKLPEETSEVEKEITEEEKEEDPEEEESSESETSEE